MFAIDLYYIGNARKLWSENVGQYNFSISLPNNIIYQKIRFDKTRQGVLCIYKNNMYEFKSLREDQENRTIRTCDGTDQGCDYVREESIKRWKFLLKQNLNPVMDLN